VIALVITSKTRLAQAPGNVFLPQNVYENRPSCR